MTDAKIYYNADGVEITLRCNGCGKSPSELTCYTMLLEPGQSADDYVMKEEGTLNFENGHFLCDECYIKAGMPSSPTGWVAP
jgi:hypothetical protein